VHVGERPLDAEHHRRRADAEREGEDGRDGECLAGFDAAQNSYPRS
jgi:hypothetical protein